MPKRITAFTCAALLFLATQPLLAQGVSLKAKVINAGGQLLSGGQIKTLTNIGETLIQASDTQNCYLKAGFIRILPLIPQRPPPDTIAPNISINPVTSPINQNVTLTYILSDNLTLPDEIKVTGDNSPYTQEGAYDVTLTATDLAENSSFASISFVIDKTPPTGTITINNGSQYANSDSVTLSLNATDTLTQVTHMQFSHDSSSWPTPEAYSTTKNWVLLAGDGAKTVYARFKNAAGGWSQIYPAAIILDQTKPAILITEPRDQDIISD